MHTLVKHHIHNSKYLERNRIYWAMSLKTFGVSLVGVFVPAYLYTLGYSLEKILLYFLVRELIELVMVLPTTSAMKWFGVKRTFILGCFLTIGNLYLLYILADSPSVFLATAVAEGLAISLFFLPYHFLFSAAVTKKDGGTQLGLMDIIVCIVAALGPLIGGFIAEATSLQMVLLIALAFVVIATFPLIRSKDNHHLKNVRYIRPLKMLNSRDSVSNMGFGVTEMVATIIWPLFIYLTVKNFAVMGVIVSISILVVIFMDIIVGKMTDNGGKANLLKYGSYGSAVTHGFRFAGTSVVGIWIINFASDITHTLFRIPWTAEFYMHASAKERASYIAAMEFAVCVGRTALWLCLFVLAGILPEKALFFSAFVLGAMGSLLVPTIYRPSTKSR